MHAMLKRSFLTFLLLNFLLCTHAQEKFTLNGYVKDSLSRETLIGANISVKEEGRGATTNQYGFFSLTLAKGNYELLVSYVGYQSKLVSVNFDGNKTINVLLVPGSADLNNVTVYGRKRESNVKSAQMGKIEL